jgi:hypothetical protein
METGKAQKSRQKIFELLVRKANANITLFCNGTAEWISDFTFKNSLNCRAKFISRKVLIKIEIYAKTYVSSYLN